MKSILVLLISLLVVSPAWAIPPSPPTTAGAGDMTKAVYDADSNNVVDSCTVADTVAVVDSTDASSSICMFDSATGSLAPKTDAGLTYNASTGVLTATGFSGPLTGAVTGNASTATALAADPADCAAGQIATGIAASGALTCTATPSGLTSVGATTFTGALTGNASTATALAANGSNCAAGTVALGVDASGAGECTSATDLTWGTGSTYTSTYNASAGTDCTVAWGNNTVNTTCGTNTITGNAVVTGTLTTGASQTIVMSANNGTLTIKGEGDGADENLTFDFNTDSDVVTVGSTTSVARLHINIAALSLGTDPADAGTIRLPNAASIVWEDGTEASITHVDNVGWTFSESITIADSKKIVFDESAANPDDADIELSATDGVFKIAAANGANNEDITIDLDQTSNTAIVSSSTGLTDISFSALNLATTGTIMGAIKINSDANGMTSGEMTTAGMYGTLFVATGAGTWNLPAAAAGMSFCMLVPTAAAVIINPDDSDVLVYDGTADTAGHQISGGAANGDFICFIAVDTTNWHSMGRRGTWTPGS